MTEDDEQFAGLSLDEIIQLTRADSDNAGELAGQGEAAADLASRVSSAIVEIAKAAENISGPEWQSLESFFSGFSADSTVKRVRQLSETTIKAGDAIAPQSTVFADLSQRAVDTHNQVEGLRTERQNWLDRLDRDPDDEELNAEFGGIAGRLGLPGDAAALRKEIHERYDNDARGVMTSATSGYLESVNGLESVPTYDGPRTSRPATGSIEADLGTYDAPGPRLQSAPVDTSAPASAPPPPPPGPGDVSHGGPPPLQPELQTPGAPPAPAPAPAPAPVGDVYQPVKPVVPPVIGGRPTPAPGRTTPPPAPRPTARPTTSPSALGGQRSLNPTRTATGMTPPGARPTGMGGTPMSARQTGAGPRSAPLRQPDGLSRPVIGGRGGTGTGASGARSTGPAGTGRAAGRPGPQRTGTGPAPGVRAADGVTRPVIGGRGGNPPRFGAPSPGRAADGLSRPVIGGRGEAASRWGGSDVSRAGTGGSPRTDGLSRPVIGGRSGDASARAGRAADGFARPGAAGRDAAGSAHTGRPAISGRVANGSDRSGGPRGARPADAARFPSSPQPGAGVRAPATKPAKQPKPLLSRGPVTTGAGPEAGVRAPRTRPHDPGGHIIGRRAVERDEDDEPGFDWSR